MRKKKNLRALLALLIVLIHIAPSYSNGIGDDTSSQASLGEILFIEKVIVDTTEYNPGHMGDFLANMTKTGVTVVTPTINNMTFTPVKIKIATNKKTPLTVNATFDSLIHNATATPIPTADLSVSPASRNLPNPFNGIITDPFDFASLIRTTTLTGPYTGTISFSVVPEL